MKNTIIEKRPITVVLEPLASQLKEFTRRDVVLNELGVNKEKLIGESVRYTLIHGENTNFVEMEAPLDTINDNIDNIFPVVGKDPSDDDYASTPENDEVLKAIDRFTDKALEITADSIIENHSVLCTMPAVMNMHQRLRSEYGNNYDLELNNVTVNKELGTVTVNLSLSTEIDVGDDPLL